MFKFIINRRYVKLLFLIQEKPKTKLRELSRTMDMDYGRLGIIVTQLKTEGIIEKKLNPELKNVYDIELTPKGEKVVKLLRGIDKECEGYD